MGKFTGRVDPETNLAIVRTADAHAEEMQNVPFRRGLLQRTNQRRTLYDQYGNPLADLKVHDSGNTEVEFDEHQDATVRPQPVRLQLTVDQYNQLLQRASSRKASSP